MGAMTFEERAKAEGGMKYTLSDVPSTGETLLFGMQHYLMMLGATVLIPRLIVPAMGGDGDDVARVICCIFFVSGLNTLIQTTFGDRLPIVQGGSFAFLGPTFAIIGNPKLQAIANPSERFEETMCVLQGAIIVSGILQIGMAYSGIMTFLLRYISPITIAPTIASIGLGLYGAGFSGVGGCVEVGLVQIALVILFSQYLKNVEVPIPGLGPQKIFSFFPVLLGIVVCWIWALILTESGAFDAGSPCRTDAKDDILEDAPWFRFPYPGQWGTPKFESYAIAPIFGGALASMIESVGDYYACAEMAGAPPPTGVIISRGLGGEGFGLLLCGLIGTGNGTTSYSENIGALQLTKVGSRRCVQAAGAIMMFFGLIGKFGALFAMMPDPMTSALYCTLFGLIASVGISNLRHTDQTSSRNLFIVGFAIFNALSVAGPGGYFNTLDYNPFDTGDEDADAVFLSIFNTPMIIAFMSAMLLDNTVAGTREERGLHVWDKVKAEDKTFDPEYMNAYDLPLGLCEKLGYFGWLVKLETGEWPKKPPVLAGDGASVEIPESPITTHPSV